MKNCKICNNEFENKSKGTEQLYCSSTCRAIAAKKRQEEKIINHAIQQKAKIEEKQTEQSSTIIGGGISKEQSPEILSNTERKDNSPKFYGSPIDSGSGKNYIHEYFEARISNNALELKNQYLEKRVLELEREIFDLNSELDSLDQGEDTGIIGNIMEQFKKDPVNSVKFATSIIENLTKSK
jgi:hypothetical protein